MADTYKVLGQLVVPVPGTMTDLYVVPPSKAAVVSTLQICNQTKVDQTFRISVAIGGAVDTPAQYLYFDATIRKNDSIPVTLGYTLATTDKIRVTASSNSVSFNLFGAEVAV